MLLLLKKRGKIKKFRDHYDKLIKEAQELSKINMDLSEQKLTEAEITLRLIHKLKNNKF